MTMAITAPKFDPKQEAQEHKLFIEQYLNIKLDDFRDFRALKAAYVLCLSHQSGERLPRTKRIRADHYRGVIRFMAVAMLYTDHSQNVIVAKTKVHKKWIEIAAGNSFFMNKLDIVKSTLDELIKTVKRLGWYISNIRFGYDVCGDSKRYYGKYSIKRVFIGFYDLIGMGKKIRDTIKKAVAFRARHPQKATNNQMSELLEGEFHKFGYGKENERRYIKRKAKREVNKALANQPQTNTTNRPNHDELVAEQMALISKGYSPKQIADHQSGVTLIDDNIPY